ncbi:hypothetical protein C8R44DRAFT_858682 [Mycena epipterygia]|nr:hypothetical protein C8R44DRAFT_858682 [Mycena epipterygia]
MYSTLGIRAEKHANGAAHSLGFSPDALAERIRVFFGDGVQRESALSELRDMVPRKLQKDCGRLTKYTLPKLRITEHATPGFQESSGGDHQLRRIFLHCESFINAGAQEDAIAALWDRPGYLWGEQ